MARAPGDQDPAPGPAPGHCGGGGLIRGITFRCSMCGMTPALTGAILLHVCRTELPLFSAIRCNSLIFLVAVCCITQARERGQPIDNPLFFLVVNEEFEALTCGFRFRWSWPVFRSSWPRAQVGTIPNYCAILSLALAPIRAGGCSARPGTCPAALPAWHALFTMRAWRRGARCA